MPTRKGWAQAIAIVDKYTEEKPMIKTPRDAPPYYASNHAAAAAWAAGWNDAKRDNLSATAPYSNDTTSKAAAKKIAPRLTGIRGTVLTFIKNRGAYGATGSEIAASLQILLYTAKPRCTELSEAGIIRDSGVTRSNKNGNQEVVWVSA